MSKKPAKPVRSETLKKAAAIFKTKHDHGPPEGHLSLKELSIAIFDDFKNLPEHQINRIRYHLERCSLCANLIIEERSASPLFVGLQKHRATGRPEQEYWDEIQKIIQALKEKTGISKKDDDVVITQKAVAQRLIKLVNFSKEFFRRVSNFVKKNY